MIVYKPVIVKKFLDQTIVTDRVKNVGGIYAGFDFSIVLIRNYTTGLNEIYISGNN